MLNKVGNKCKKTVWVSRWPGILFLSILILFSGAKAEAALGDIGDSCYIKTLLGIKIKCPSNDATSICMCDEGQCCSVWDEASEEINHTCFPDSTEGGSCCTEGSWDGTNYIVTYTCSSDFQCTTPDISGGVCEPIDWEDCGNLTEDCCETDPPCNDTLVCRDKKCYEEEPDCGGLNATCCDNQTCEKDPWCDAMECTCNTDGFCVPSSSTCGTRGDDCCLPDYSAPSPPEGATIDPYTGEWCYAGEGSCIVPNPDLNLLKVCGNLNDYCGYTDIRCCVEGEDSQYYKIPGDDGCWHTYDDCIDGTCVRTDEGDWVWKDSRTLLDYILYGGPIISNLEDLLSPLFQILFYGGLFTGVLGVIYAGYLLISSEGDPGKVQEGKNQLTASVLGTLFVLLSVLILRVIISSIMRVDSLF